MRTFALNSVFQSSYLLAYVHVGAKIEVTSVGTAWSPRKTTGAIFKHSALQPLRVDCLVSGTSRSRQAQA